MNKHKYKDPMHCSACFDKATKALLERDERIAKNPPPIIVSPDQYPFILKHGLTVGMMRWLEEKSQ